MRTNLLLLGLAWVAALYLVGEPVWAARVALVVAVYVLVWFWWKRAASRGGVRSRPAVEQPPPVDDGQTPVLPEPGDRPAPAGPERLPLGVGERGRPLVWDLDTCPHMLVSGKTGTGKSEVLRGLAVDSAALGSMVFVADVKRMGSLPLRDIPGIQRAVSPRAVVDMVREVYRLMFDRYEQLEAGQSVDELPRVLLVIDELRAWVQAANDLWRDEDRAAVGGNRGSTTEHVAVREFNALAGLGREARVHLLVGIQRPDAKALGDQGGDARDNFPARLALGSLSQQAAIMMFGDAETGRKVAKLPGCGTLSLDDEAVAVRTYRWRNPARVY